MAQSNWQKLDPNHLPETFWGLCLFVAAAMALFRQIRQFKAEFGERSLAVQNREKSRRCRITLDALRRLRSPRVKAKSNGSL